jgi:hypothetical protein
VPEQVAVGVVGCTEIAGNARPVPVIKYVAGSPPVVLVAVSVAFLAPAVLGVKVTSKVTLPSVGIVVEDKLLTTNSGLLETTATPSAVAAPLLVSV